MALLARLKALYWKLPSRRARPASVVRNLLKTLCQTLVMWTIFLIVGPLLLWRIETLLFDYNWPLQRFFPLPIFALVLFVIGWLVAWWSAWILVRWGDGTPLPIDATNRLVVRGPYRWIRNPMETASLMQGAAIGFACGSPLILIYVLAGGWLWNVAVRPWEETDLLRRFGSDYEDYRKQVRCWWPRIKPYDSSLFES